MASFKQLIKRLIVNLWTQEYIFWWIISIATLLMFYVFWMMQSTFRPFTYFVFWPILFLSSFFLTIPSLVTGKGILQVVWLLFFDSLFVANLMYHRTYYSAIPLKSYALVGNLADFSASVTDSFQWYFIFLPILTLLAFLFFYFNKRITRKRPSPVSWAFYCLICFIVAFFADIPNGGAVNRMRALSESSNLKSAVIPIYSLGGYWISDYLKTNEKLSPQNLEEVREWLDTHHNITAAYWNDSTRLYRKSPRNLVLILCESLESWVLQKNVEGIEITPNLNRLISDSTTFFAPNVVTQVGAGRSIEGQLLVTTGLLPMLNQVYAYDAIDSRYFSLPKALKQHNGAKTLLFSCDKPYVWNQKPVADAFGYDKLWHNGDFENTDPVGIFRLLSDGALMTQIVEKLKTRPIWSEDENAMVTVVTFSGHNPFVLPDHLRRISFKGDMPEMIKNYMITANYTDYSLQIFIDYLRSRSDWEDTMVVITGDHEGLAIDRQNAVNNPVSGKFVDPLQHTPLIILNSPVAGRYDREMGQVDIYSTILDLMNIPEYPWKGLGYSVISPDAPGIAIGSSGEVVTNLENPDPETISGLKKARTVSDRIIKFDLLQHYPDSISNN